MYEIDSTFKSEKNKLANQPVYLYTIHDYDSLSVEGMATSTLTNHLVDTEANFVSSDIGRFIHNTTDNTYALITAVNSTTDVTLNKDIMTDDDNYVIETNLCYAEYDIDITYDSIPYTKFAVKRGEIGENSNGQIDTFTLTLGNVSRLIQAYLENYDLRGKKVTVKLVWANQLNDTDAYINFIYYIDSYTANQDSVEFVLSSKFDVLDIELPFGRYSRTICRWKFRFTECGYSGAETTCDKRKTTCNATMNNVGRYGAFPSIPTGRIFI